ncbi:LytTR family DNA-binding domain-containing protein [Gaetbulibacter jejuensis]|uniref:LytTR family DNA-binding domain-containing protein n=1 Tax=Gaetbulibacter TaxID=311207 RepID=UPI0031D223E3
MRIKLVISIIIGVFLSFVIIFLEPFNTNEYKSSFRTLLLIGFGFLLSLVYVIQSVFENIWYRRFNKVWKVYHEIVSILVFFVVSGSVIFLYNTKVINGLDYSIEAHWWYYKNIVFVFIPILTPPLFYLRNKLGERILPIDKSIVIVTGENKKDFLKLEKKKLLYIKAVQNYIEICFLENDTKVSTKMFRQTLSNAHKQLPYLEKCHRSYLLNIGNIKKIKGNSQNAKVSFNNVEQMIPLSKTYYNKIKSKLFIE